MKKHIKKTLAIVSITAVLAGNAFATGGNGSGNEPEIKKGSGSSVCDYLPFLCATTTRTGGNGSGNEPKKD